MSMNAVKEEIISNQTKNLLCNEDRKTSQGFVDLKTKTIEQLEELIERQNKILEKRAFVLKLPDKGEKIFLFISAVKDELEKRQKEYHSTCQQFSNLTLKDSCSDEIEWNKGQQFKSSEKLDSDDESDKEMDPLKLLACHSGTVEGKIIKNFSEPDLIDSKTAEKTIYCDKFCKKYGNLISPKVRYKPNQLKECDKNVFKISAEKIKYRLGNKWEVTQATPPVPVFEDTEYISLSESLKLQKEQAKRLRDLEKKHAAERLKKTLSINLKNDLPSNFISEYRTPKDIFDETPAVDENESIDFEAEEKEKILFYNEKKDDFEIE